MASLRNLLLGIKVGPDNFKRSLQGRLAPPCAEVYFNLHRLHEYDEIFCWLAEKAVSASLHISTPLHDGTVPNLATNDSRVREESRRLAEDIIAVAAARRLPYVIMHPGSYRLQRNANGVSNVFDTELQPSVGDKILHQEAAALHEHARQRGVQILFENLPAFDFSSTASPDPQQQVDPQFIPLRTLERLGQAGIGLCIDIGHLIGELSMAWAEPAACMAAVMKATASVAPYARCLHVSTVIPPLCGVDSHYGFLEKDYRLGVVPSPAELLAWLALFSGDGLWVIPEPYGEAEVHVENYEVLRAMLTQPSAL